MDEAQKPPPAADPPAGPYAGYETWKRWNKLFSYDDEEAAYFQGEMRGVAIAGADLLEIGFGPGCFLAWAKDKGARVSGIEVISALIAAAREEGVTLLPAEFETVAAGHAEAFDTIVAFDVFEHFALIDLVARLAACGQMLRPGGHLVLRFPNAQSPFGLAPQNGDPTHKIALSRGVLEQLTQTSGLHVTRYAPAFRIRGGSPGKALARALRYLARDAIAAALNAIYSQSIPWDPVVVIVLRKGAAEANRI